MIACVGWDLEFDTMMMEEVAPDLKSSATRLQTGWKPAFMHNFSMFASSIPWGLNRMLFGAQASSVMPAPGPLPTGPPKLPAVAYPWHSPGYCLTTPRG